MYELRFGKLEDLKELGENKERVEELLIQLAELGWPVSHWSENHPKTENEKFFIEIYGDETYKHIKGKTVQECYEKAVKSVEKLKVCEHDYNTREDSFQICKHCGKFNRATLEEMKSKFKQFSIMASDNVNRRYYSDKPLCEKCDSNSLLHFGFSMSDDKGSFCESCGTVYPKRRRKGSEMVFGKSHTQVNPGHEDFSLGLKYDSSKSSIMDLSKIMTLGTENERTLRRKVINRIEEYNKHFVHTLQVINPKEVYSVEKLKASLKKSVLSADFNFIKEDEQFKVRDIKFEIEEDAVGEIPVKSLSFSLSLIPIKDLERRRKSDTEVLKDVIESLANSEIDNQKKSEN